MFPPERHFLYTQTEEQCFTEQQPFTQRPPKKEHKECSSSYNACKKWKLQLKAELKADIKDTSLCSSVVINTSLHIECKSVSTALASCRPCIAELEQKQQHNASIGTWRRLIEGDIRVPERWALHCAAFFFTLHSLIRTSQGQSGLSESVQSGKSSDWS